ncbi:MAG: glycosyltransferase family 2 protein [bacterium]|nr:glycosyltransferase family 2 protein [bacterium]
MISVIIPNWNGMNLLKDCLPSLKNQTYQDFEIILVDNGSTDSSVEWTRMNYPEVRIIELKENMGFSKAVNCGIKEAKGDLIALLNNDTIADSNWLFELNKALSTHQVDFCASKVLFLGKDNLINSCGDSYGVDGRARNIGFREKDNGQYREKRLVFGASACASIYKRSLFNKIGLFDPDFFLVYEDVDFSFRAQLAGFKCLYVPEARVYHLYSVTRRLLDHMDVYYIAKNNLNVLVKNMPSQLFMKYLFFILKGQIREATYFSSNGYLRYFLWGKIGALFQLFKMLYKRGRIQAKREVSIEYIDSILEKNIL